MPLFWSLPEGPNPPVASASRLISALKAELIQLRQAVHNLRTGLDRNLNNDDVLKHLYLWVYVGRTKAVRVLDGAMADGRIQTTGDIGRSPLAMQGVLDAVSFLRPDLNDSKFWRECDVTRFASPETLATLDRIIADLETWHATETPAAPRVIPETTTKAPAGGTDSESIARPEAPPVGIEERAIAAAYALLKEGKSVSVKAACERAGVNRGHLMTRYPGVVEIINAIAAPSRVPKRGSKARDGRIEAVDDGDE